MSIPVAAAERLLPIAQWQSIRLESTGTSRSVRALLALVLVYLVAEGALRKWAFPAYGSALFLAKDVIIMLATVAYLGHRALAHGRGRIFTPLERLFWILWVVYFGLHVVYSGISATSIVGARYYLAVAPLSLLVAASLRSFDELEWMARLYLVIALVVCVLGIAQFTSPPDAAINRYAWSNTDYISTFGASNRPRITGTFSFIAPFSFYLQFVFLLAWTMYFLSPTPIGRLTAACAIGLVFTNVVMTGSRYTFAMCVACSLPFLARLFRAQRTRKRRVVLGVVTLAVFGAILQLANTPLTSLGDRSREASDATPRVAGTLLSPYFTLTRAEPFGSGIGSTFQGFREVNGQVEKASFSEVANDRIGIETGYFGLLLALFAKVYFTLMGYRLWRRAASEEGRLWGLMALMFQLSLMWQITIYNSTAAMLFFVTVGVTVWVRNADAASRAHRAPIRFRGVVSR